jgi:hypothetical protein
MRTLIRYLSTWTTRAAFVLGLILMGANAGCAPETVGKTYIAVSINGATPLPSWVEDLAKALDEAERAWDLKMLEMWNRIDRNCGQWEVWCEYV